VGTSRPQGIAYDIGAFEVPVAATTGTSKILQQHG